MNQLTIQTKNFDSAKNQLKKFSSNPELNTPLNLSKTKGVFGLFSHNVTGTELNTLTVDIQKNLIEIRNQNIKIVKEFFQVYQALEALDKDYIHAIITSIKKIEEVSNNTRILAEKTEKNTLDIVSTIEMQKKTIQVLAKFKDNYEKAQSDDKINLLWDYYQKNKRNKKCSCDEQLNITDKYPIKSNQFFIIMGIALIISSSVIVALLF